MSKLNQEELLKDLDFVLATWKRHYPHKLRPMRILQIFENFQQIKERIQKKFVKLHDANIKWIEDIIDIVMESVSCDHEEDEDGAGKKYYSASYCLNDQQDVIKKCIEAIPEVELKLEVDEKFMEEKAKLIVENLYMYKMDKTPHYVPSASERKHYNIKMKVARNFLQQIFKELEEKIN